MKNLQTNQQETRYKFFSFEKVYEPTWKNQPINGNSYTIEEIHTLAIGKKPDYIFWTESDILAFGGFKK